MTQDFDTIDVLRLEVGERLPGNLIPNPEFVTNTTGWSVVGGTLTASGTYGAFVASATGSNNNVTTAQADAAHCRPGQLFTAAADVKAQVTSLPYRIYLVWYTDTFTFISSSFFQSASLGGTVFTRLAVSAPAPANAKRVRVQIAAIGTLPAGSGFHLTRVSLTPTAAEMTYPPAPNLLKNPHGVGGAWGWITPPAGAPASGAFLGGYSEQFPAVDYIEFSLTGAANVENWYTSEPEPVAAGEWCSAQFRLRAALPAAVSSRISIQYLDTSGAVISTQAGPSIPGGTAANTTHRFHAPAAAPAGTVNAVMKVSATHANTLGSISLRIDSAMLTKGATAAHVKDVAFVEPYVYTDVLLPSHDIAVERAGLSLGTLTARLRDTSLDPAVASLIRPGNPVRLMARIADAAGAYVGTTYEPLFVGEIKSAGSKYELTHPDPAKRTLITINAVDATARLANLKQPQGVSQISDLRYLLEGASTPFRVRDASNPDIWQAGQIPGSPGIVSRNENASILDQIALTRDTQLGHAWVNKWGRMSVFTAPKMDTTVRATLAEVDYNADIDIDFDTTRLINVVTIKRQGFDPEGKPVETVFGPYVSDASVAKWGSFAAEFTVVGMADGAVEAHATAILAANAEPVVQVNRLTLPVTHPVDFRTAGPTTFEHRAHLDVYDRVTVNNDRAAISQTLRVASLRHRITPKKWLLDLSFASTGGAAMPSPAPALPEGVLTFPDTPWANLTLVNGWTNNNANSPARYRRLGGVVYIEGVILPGTNAHATGCATLPAGFRPGGAAGTEIRKTGDTNSTSHLAGRFDIQTGGVIKPQGAVTWLDISCSFVASQ